MTIRHTDGGAAARPRVSLCLILRDEEANSCRVARGGGPVLLAGGRVVSCAS